MTDGPINLKIELTPGSRQRKSGEYLNPSPASGGSWTANCSAPPNKVPIARPINARGPKSGSIHAPNVTPPTMEPMLKKLDAMAGMPKTPFAFSIPITKAAIDTSTMNGNMMRVSCAVRAAFCGSKPGANAPTSCAENTMPTTQIEPKTMSVSVATLFASRQAAASPLRAMVLLNVVTNAVDSAPSANRSRSRFGMRKAAVNASIAPPPPNNAAHTCSRTRPSTRLHITASPTMPAAFVFKRSVRTSGATVSAASGDVSGGYFGPLPELMSDRCLKVPLVYSFHACRESSMRRAMPLALHTQTVVEPQRPTTIKVTARAQGQRDSTLCSHAKKAGGASSRSAPHGGDRVGRHRAAGRRRTVPHARAARYVANPRLRHAGPHQLRAGRSKAESLRSLVTARVPVPI